MENKNIQRNYGIDLLRIIAMIMIVTLHTLGKGGVLSVVSESTLHFHVAWILKTTCFCAVNCYALISGFVLYNRPFSISRIVHLWLTIVFYTIITTLFALATNHYSLNMSVIYDALFPITRGVYWYLTAYFAMYLFSPLLNIAVDSTSKSFAKGFFSVTFILMSILPTIWGKDPFCLEGGFSPLWLCILYLAGAAIKKYNFSLNNSRKIIATFFFISITITYITKLVLAPLISKIWNIDSDGGMFISYTSPTIIFAAIALLCICKDLQVGRNFQWFIQLFAPATLGVYIIHTHPFIWNCYISNFAKAFVGKTFFLFVLDVALSIVLIWSLCSLIDIVRQQLFKKIKIRELSQKIAILLTKEQT